MKEKPTIFHITHPKAGSQWVRAILTDADPGRIVDPKVKRKHFFEEPICPGMIYPALYVTRNQFETTVFPGLKEGEDKLEHNEETSHQNWSNFVVEKKPILRFLVVRDLRDTLVSLYFSLKHSHPEITNMHKERRKVLSELNLEEGMLYLLEDALKNAANIQKSWIQSVKRKQILMIKYEDLMRDEHSYFEEILNFCQIRIDRNKLDAIVKRNSFESVSGRKKGQADVSSHLRQGAPADWKNYFSDNLKREFRESYGKILIDLDYETDDNW